MARVVWNMSFGDQVAIQQSQTVYVVRPRKQMSVNGAVWLAAGMAPVPFARALSGEPN